MLEYLKRFKNIIIIVIIFVIGVFIGSNFFPKTNTIEVEKEVIKDTVKEEVVSNTQTGITYIPKETVIIKYIDKNTGEEKTVQETEKTDMQADIGKKDFNVKVNGKEIAFQKAENEKFMFEKNKVVLTQESRVTFDVKVPTVDRTRKWGLGIGASKHGLAGSLDFPLYNSGTVGGWIAGDKETVMGGVKIKF